MISDLEKKSWDYDLIAMAYHEASHTVCGLHNYMYVCDANVMTPERQEGVTMYYSYGYFEEFIDSTVKDDELRNLLLVFEIQTLYAGLIGEKLYYKDICGSNKFPNHLKKGSSYDTKLASSLIRKNKLATPGKQTFLLKKQISFDVEQMLVTHWDAAKIIAHYLYQKKKLSFDEIKYALTRKTEHNDFWKYRFKNIEVIHSEKHLPTEDTVKSIIMNR